MAKKKKQTYAERAKAIVARYKKRLGDNLEEYDDMAIAAMNRELEELAVEQEEEKQRQQEEQMANQMALGGFLSQMADGGELDSYNSRLLKEKTPNEMKFMNAVALNKYRQGKEHEKALGKYSLHTKDMGTAAIINEPFTERTVYNQFKIDEKKALKAGMTKDEVRAINAGDRAVYGIRDTSLLSPSDKELLRQTQEWEATIKARGGNLPRYDGTTQPYSYLPSVLPLKEQNYFTSAPIVPEQNPYASRIPTEGQVNVRVPYYETTPPETPGGPVQYGPRYYNRPDNVGMQDKNIFGDLINYEMLKSKQFFADENGDYVAPPLNTTKPVNPVYLPNGLRSLATKDYLEPYTGGTYVGPPNEQPSEVAASVQPSPGAPPQQQSWWKQMPTETKIGALAQLMSQAAGFPIVNKNPQDLNTGETPMAPYVRANDTEDKRMAYNKYVDTLRRSRDFNPGYYSAIAAGAGNAYDESVARISADTNRTNVAGFNDYNARLMAIKQGDRERAMKEGMYNIENDLNRDSARIAWTQGVGNTVAGAAKDSLQFRFDQDALKYYNRTNYGSMPIGNGRTIQYDSPGGGLMHYWLDGHETWMIDGKPVDQTTYMTEAAKYKPVTTPNPIATR